MKWQTQFSIVVGVILLALGGIGFSIFYPIYRHEAWVISLLKRFDEMPYAAWEEVYDACETLAASHSEAKFTKNSPGYSELPDPIRDLEPLFVWVKPDRITLRFSGGHSRYVHLEYWTDRSPPKLELLAEWYFTDIVYPRTDQRPIKQLRTSKVQSSVP